VNSDGLTGNPTKKRTKHANPKDSALFPDWNESESQAVGSASRTKDPEEDDSMVQSGGFVGDDETDDLERKSLLGFKGGKKTLVGLYIYIIKTDGSY
jgi:hypothetical protein